MLTVRDALDELPGEALDLLTAKRGTRSPRTLHERRNVLSRSYRGRTDLFFADLREKDLETLLTGIWYENGKAYRLRNVSSHTKAQLEGIARALFEKDGMPSAMERVPEEDELEDRENDQADPIATVLELLPKEVVVYLAEKHHLSPHGSKTRLIGRVRPSLPDDLVTLVSSTMSRSGWNDMLEALGGSRRRSFEEIAGELAILTATNGAPEERLLVPAEQTARTTEAVQSAASPAAASPDEPAAPALPSYSHVELIVDDRGLSTALSEASRWCEVMTCLVPAFDTHGARSPLWQAVSPSLHKLDRAYLALEGLRTDPIALEALYRIGALRVITAADNSVRAHLWIFRRGREQRILSVTGMFGGSGIVAPMVSATAWTGDEHAPYALAAQSVIGRARTAAYLPEPGFVESYRELLETMRPSVESVLEAAAARYLRRVAVGTSGEALQIVREPDKVRDAIGRLRARLLETASPEHDLVFSSTQTASKESNLGFIENFKRAGNDKLFVVLDEAHHAPAPKIAKLLRVFKEWNCPVLGLTATPVRADEEDARRLSALFNQTVFYQVSRKTLTEAGILATAKFETVKTAINFEREFTTEDIRHLEKYGDLGPHVLKRLGEHAGRNKLIVEHYKKRAVDYGSTIVFAANTLHAQTLAKEFQKAGVDADYVDYIRIPLELIEEAYRLLQSNLRPELQGVFACLPLGWYVWEEAFEDDQQRRVAMVYDHQQEAFEQLLADHADGSKLPAEISEAFAQAMRQRYFGDLADPLPRWPDIKDLLQARKKGCELRFYTFEERRSFDPKTIAAELIGRHASFQETYAKADEVWSANAGCRLVYHEDAKAFRDDIMSAVQQAMNPPAPPAPPQIVEITPKVPHAWPEGQPGYSLVELRDAVFSIKKHFPNGPPTVQDISWTKKPNRRYFGLCRYSDNSIVIERTLNSPDIPRFAMEYLLYHELLHADMPHAAHNKDFRARERLFQPTQAAIEEATARGIHPGSTVDAWRILADSFFDTFGRYYAMAEPGSTMAI